MVTLNNIIRGHFNYNIPRSNPPKSTMVIFNTTLIYHAVMLRQIVLNFLGYGVHVLKI